jgi:hypothetical protein
MNEKTRKRNNELDATKSERVLLIGGQVFKSLFRQTNFSFVCGFIAVK